MVVADKSHALIREHNTKVGGFFIFYNQVTNGDCGGIYAVNSSVMVSGENCRVAHNGVVGNGGGVWLSNSTLQVVDGAAIGGAGLVNVALQDGGGVHMQHSTLLLSNGAAICNSSAATNGGGIMAYESVIIGVDQAAIGESGGVAGNQAYNGSGMFLVSSSAMFVRARLSGNTAANAGGGIAAVGTSDLACTETSIAGNTATNYGACVFSGLYGGARFDNCLIMSNVARGSSGVIFSYMAEPLVLTNGTRLVYNEAGVDVGGLVLLGGRAAVEGSEVAYNRARRVAGGIMLMPYGRLTVCDSDVHHNQAEQGGGVYAVGGEIQMRAVSRACGMQSNSAVHGGGVYASGGTRIMCEGAPTHVLTLGGNVAETNGGWLCASTGVTAMVAGNVLIEGNRADVGGAAVVLTNCVLEVCASNGAALAVCDNVARSAGGAVVVLDRGSRVMLRNAHVRGNISRGTASIYGGGAILAGINSTVEASDCLFEGNISSNLGGAISTFGMPRRLAIGSTFSGAPGFLPAMQFKNNYARTYGGALCVLGCVETEIANTLMLSNAAGVSGGAILFGESYTGRVVNTIFTRNWAGANGDAVAAGEFYQFEMQHCTVADNHSNGVANISTTMGMPLLENCIVWGHITSQILGTATVRFSDVQGGYPGPFNLDTNPVFFAPGTLRYDLAESSPCIDKGATLFMITNDCIGTVRPYGAGWDMGAYEFVPEPGGVWGMLVAIGFTIYDLQFTIGRRRKR